MENETGRDAQILLRLPIRDGFEGSASGNTRPERAGKTDDARVLHRHRPRKEQNKTLLEIIKRWIAHCSRQMIRTYKHLHPTYRKQVIAKLPVVCPVCPGNEMQVIL